MNIFQALSQGKSRLHEPSMSAMLGYLLDSNRDHGLGDAFVRQFLEAVDKERFRELLTRDFIDSQVSLEEPYELDNSRKDIDIQLLILDESKNENHRIIIENKIKPGAARVEQLAEYYAAVIGDEPDLEELTFLFLTPYSNSPMLTKEFNNLELLNDYHKKYWIHWMSDETCIVSIIREILLLEASGKINPINEYIRHTLKAFSMHCATTAESQKKRVMRTGEDIGEIVDEVDIETKSGCYRVVRRDSTQIQVFDIESGDKEVARHVLAQYIDENGIDIPHWDYNTRTIGRKFFDWIRTT
ncbi:PD-(D/E)XK nuclease family protein [Vibrio kanaloae]|uniref:PD-(D/E)XK nuclease family protein n=1 Tax=Vibrio kanaloae TaxID=170673 RepID=UPI0010BD051C|nr:PD-(D/E)XK nuclease family protein [Vibrio kanaloae]TKF02593.1 hypothetical protein FCV46_15270 [Vibrio kanaloae]TKF62623.1 hypothetical protein FCV51_07955 [Vibrio kanaloae]